jgi:hypothetical protein
MDPYLATSHTMKFFKEGVLHMLKFFQQDVVPSWNEFISGDHFPILDGNLFNDIYKLFHSYFPNSPARNEDELKIQYPDIYAAIFQIKHQHARSFMKCAKSLQGSDFEVLNQDCLSKILHQLDPEYNSQEVLGAVPTFCWGAEAFGS